MARGRAGPVGHGGHVRGDRNGGRQALHVLPEVLSAYNLANSNEWKNGRGEEVRLEQVIRARDPYPLLETLR